MAKANQGRLVGKAGSNPEKKARTKKDKLARAMDLAKKYFKANETKKAADKLCKELKPELMTLAQSLGVVKEGTKSHTLPFADLGIQVQKQLSGGGSYLNEEFAAEMVKAKYPKLAKKVFVAFDSDVYAQLVLDGSIKAKDNKSVVQESEPTEKLIVSRMKKNGK